MNNIFSLLIKIIDWVKKIVLPGFDGIPVYQVLMFFFKGLQKGAITTRASSISFSFFLALFPLVIVFFTLIPYVPIENFQESLLLIMKNLIPEKAYNVVESTLFDIITQPRSGLLSLGFLLAVYFSTNGVNNIIDAFNATYHTISKRSFFKQYVVSIALVFIILFIIITGVSLITIGPIVLNFLVAKGILFKGIVIVIILLIKWIVIIGIFFFGYSFLYYLGPEKKNQFRFISAGSSFATLLTILTSVVFNYYVNNFSRYNALYGSIGTLLLILVWIYFNSIIVLIGFELNASIAHTKKHDKKEISYLDKEESIDID